MTGKENFPPRVGKGKDMLKKSTRIGGFVAQNSGTVTNCYSTVELKVRGAVTGGFFGENSGTVSKSFCVCKLNHLQGGFAGSGNGNQEDSCYFFHNYKENDKRLKKLSDSILGQQIKEIKNDQDAQCLGYDTTTIFEYSEDKVPLRFHPDYWMFYSENPPETGPAIRIKTAEQLYDLAKKINGGDHELSNAYLVLENDINLGGKEWTPIGLDRTNAFTGLFDGMGHTVKNFIIKDKAVQNKGFFGFLKGKVYNLSVDCILKGGLCVGGIAARCDGGTIGCCSAVVEIHGEATNIGGLAGINSGEIFQSYAAGIIKIKAVPWWIIALPLVLTLSAVLVFNIGNLRSNLPIFAPVPYDPDAVINPDDSNKPSKAGNFASFQFEQNIDVDLSTGLCKFNFKNPGESNHNTVVKLQFTDAQAKKIMGSTGRTKKEQQRVESSKGYNPNTYRVTIAQSGAIRPGYMLDNLRIVDQSNGATVPPGTYKAVVYLVFYDKSTNERAMLESQLPVVITVHK